MEFFLLCRTVMENNIEALRSEHQKQHVQIADLHVRLNQYEVENNNLMEENKKISSQTQEVEAVKGILCDKEIKI